VEDACRGIELDDIKNKKEKLISKGAVVVNSKDVRRNLTKKTFSFLLNSHQVNIYFIMVKKVSNMISGKDRRPELAYSMLKLNKDY
jgi:hypothetical protein